MISQGISKVVACFVNRIENRQGHFLWEVNVSKQTKQNVRAFRVKETLVMISMCQVAQKSCDDYEQKSNKQPWNDRL